MEQFVNAKTPRAVAPGSVRLKIYERKNENAKKISEMFHVEHWQEGLPAAHSSSARSLADAELGKQLVQNVIGSGLPGDETERVKRSAKGVSRNLV